MKPALQKQAMPESHGELTGCGHSLKDLESREAAAAAGRPRPGEGPSPLELRKRAAQMDYSQRLKAKQAEVAGKQSEA